MACDECPNRKQRRVSLDACASIALLTGLLLVLAGLPGCRGSATLGKGPPTLALTSTGFSEKEFPQRFTCDGADSSPELSWSAPPPATQSFALIVVDRDAPLGSFVHWVLYDLPPDKRELHESLPKQALLPDGSRQGLNDFDKAGYGGPCPPGKKAHRYIFALYAVDSKLNLPSGSTRRDVEDALRGHILAHGVLIGRYSR